MATIPDTFALAMHYHQAGNLNQAEMFYRQVLQAQPYHPDAFHLLGVIAYQRGSHEVALDYIGRAIALDGSQARYHTNLGNVFLGRGEHERARESYQRALQLNPRDADTLNNLANVLREQGRLEQALGICLQALEVNPAQVDANNTLANIYKDLGRLDEALAACRRAIELQPGRSGAHNSLGNIQRARGEPEEAKASYERALQLDPKNVQAYSNLGSLLFDQRQLDEARQCFERAISLKPDFGLGHYNLAILLLARGDLQAGFREFEWRFRSLRTLPRVPMPYWDGSPLAGRTILLHGEQGFGDTIQFVRYAPLVKKQGATVVLACAPPLLDLLEGVAGVDHLTGEVPGHVTCDCFAPLLSLPRLLSTILETIPVQVPYLQASTEGRVRWRHDLAGLSGLRIGICWQGSPAHRNDRNRSVRLERFEPLTRVPGVNLVSLQKGHGIEQLAPLADRWHLLDLGSRIKSWTDSAAAVAELDLVITVDTAVAHLAGALGVPTWVALPFSADWRWLLDRDDSPWYPGMRLFRQTKAGDWTSVFERIAEALRARLAG
jgi:tetratricopeptide (TPR) repeat protein